MKHEEFFEKNRYTKEEAETEAGKLHDIAGKNAPAEDYKVAEQMVEDEKLSHGKLPERYSEFPKDKILIKRKHGYNAPKIILKTDDPALYKLFNDTAQKVFADEDISAYCQPSTGSEEGRGIIIWDIYGDAYAEGAHLSELVDKIYVEMHRGQTSKDRHGK